MLECITVEMASSPDASVIWMHGVGADGHDFEEIVPELKLPAGHRIRFLFPNAPVRPVTVAGYPMRAWYDITHPRLAEAPDVEGILRSARDIREVVEQEEAHGVASERIVLAGFSQGGVIALEVGPRYPRRLGGIMALSSYSPTAGLLEIEASSVNAALPVFWAHGTIDNVVPDSLMREAETQYVARHYPVEFHSYPGMDHSVCPQEIRDISVFLQKVLPPLSR